MAELKLLLEAFWPQLGTGTVALIFLLYSMIKSGKINITLFAPSHEKAVVNVTEGLLNQNVTLMTENLSATGIVIALLKEINQLMMDTKQIQHEHLEIQRRTHLEVVKQTTILQVRS